MATTALSCQICAHGERKIVILSGEVHGLLCISQSKDLRFRFDGSGETQVLRLRLAEETRQTTLRMTMVVGQAIRFEFVDTPSAVCSRYTARHGNCAHFPEQRVQVAPSRFRVPDVCAIRLGGPPGGIVREPPVVCIEILSPGDSLADMQERVDDYVAFGVENIWLIDPVRRRAWTADADGIHSLAADAFIIPGTPVHIALADVYQELDDIAAGR